MKFKHIPSLLAISLVASSPTLAKTSAEDAKDLDKQDVVKPKTQEKEKEEEKEKDKPDYEGGSEGCTHEKEKHGCDQCPEHVFSCEDPKPPKPPKPPVPSAPGPLPVMGVFSALTYSRKLRQKIKKMRIRKFCSQEMRRFAEANPLVQSEKDQERNTKRVKVLPGLALVTLFALQGCFNLDSDTGESNSYRIEEHSHSSNTISIPLEFVPSPLPLVGVLVCAALYSKFKNHRQ